MSADEFQDSHEWGFTSLIAMDPQKMFSSPGTLQKYNRHTNLFFSEFVKDIIKLVLERKEGVIEALFVLTNGVRGREVSFRVLQNICSFRAGKFQALLDFPGIVLCYGSFDPAKKAIALTYAGETSEAAKALSSMGVLGPNECYEKLVDLHPKAPEEMVIDHSDIDYDAFLCTTEDLKLAIRKAEWRKAADALGWRMKMVKNPAFKGNQSTVRPLSEDRHTARHHPRSPPTIFLWCQAHPPPQEGERGRQTNCHWCDLPQDHQLYNHAQHQIKLQVLLFPCSIRCWNWRRSRKRGPRSQETHTFPPRSRSGLFRPKKRLQLGQEVSLHVPGEGALPKAFGLGHQVYGSSSWLTVRDKELIASETGVRQGDPMGPFLFCLAIQPALKKASRLVESFSYMDDIYLVGEPTKMVQALLELEQFLLSIDLHINFNKYWVHKDSPGLSQGITTNSGILFALSKPLQVNSNPMVMKVPLSCDIAISELNAKVAESIELISTIEDTQVALLLLRQIHNGALTYMLRCAHYKVTRDFIGDFTCRVTEALASILRCKVEDIENVKQCVFMPLGPGLGFTPLTEIAPLAYQASLMKALHLLNSLYERRHPMPTPKEDSVGPYDVGLAQSLAHQGLLNSDPTPRLQHLLVEQTSSERFKAAFRQLSPQHKVIVESTLNTYASGWLTTIPSVPELRIPRDKMVIALRLFLSIPFYEDVFSCKSCGDKIEDYNQHVLICNKSNGNSHRHSDIINCTKNLCTAAELNWALEVSPFCRHKDSLAKDQCRVDIVAFAHGKKGVDVAYDVSVANPFSKAAGDHPRPLEAAMRREGEKINKYHNDCEKNNMKFYPLVFDAYGGIPSITLNSAVKPLIRKVKEYTPMNWAAPNAKTYWLQRFSVVLWKANACKVKFHSGIY